MKINEVILTESQLDELNLKGLGTGLGKVIGGAAGGVVQGAKNIWSGMKQGYTGAQQALAPDAGGTPQTQAASTASAPGAAPATGAAPSATTPTASAPGAAPATSAAAPTGGQQGKPAPAANPSANPSANPAAAQQSTMGVGQINKIIPTLRTRDLQSVKKNVDATIAKKSKQPAQAPGAQQPAPAAQKPAQTPQTPAPEDDNPNIIRGYNESKVVKFSSKFLGIDL